MSTLNSCRPPIEKKWDSISTRKFFCDQRKFSFKCYLAMFIALSGHPFQTKTLKISTLPPFHPSSLPPYPLPPFHPSSLPLSTLPSFSLQPFDPPSLPPFHLSPFLPSIFPPSTLPVHTSAYHLIILHLIADVFVGWYLPFTITYY